MNHASQKVLQSRIFCSNFLTLISMFLMDFSHSTLSHSIIYFPLLTSSENCFSFGPAILLVRDIKENFDILSEGAKYLKHYICNMLRCAVIPDIIVW